MINWSEGSACTWAFASEQSCLYLSEKVLVFKILFSNSTLFVITVRLTHPPMYHVSCIMNVYFQQPFHTHVIITVQPIHPSIMHHVSFSLNCIMTYTLWVPTFIITVHQPTLHTPMYHSPTHVSCFMYHLF